MEIDLEKLNFDTLPNEIKQLFEVETKGLKDNRDSLLKQLSELRDKLDENEKKFSATNLDLTNLKEKLGDIKIDEALRVYNEYKDYEPSTEEDEITQRVKSAMERKYEPTINGLQVKLDAAIKELDDFKAREFISKSETPIVNAVRILDKDVKLFALPYLKQSWTYDPKYDRPVGRDSQGHIITDDNYEPMKIEDYIDSKRFERDHPTLFQKEIKPSFSAISNNGNLKDITSNPWHKDTFNRTLQSKILREDKNLANKLMSEAKYKQKSLIK